MSIEINGQPTSLTSLISESNKKTESSNDPGVSSQTPATGVQGDSVNLTNTASMLKKMEATLSSVPVVDNKRIAGIRQAILNGSYTINPDRIAEKMFNMESVLNRR